MQERDSPYVFRDDDENPVGESVGSDDDVVIIEGRAMRFREYRDDEE
jgi:hypothetical protein